MRRMPLAPHISGVDARARATFFYEVIASFRRCAYWLEKTGGDRVSERRSFSEYNQRLIDEFRANNGIVTIHPSGSSLLLLTTTGAKSGRAHTTPLAYTRDGDRIVVIASKGGAPTNPAWYHNLIAHPEVMVELGGERFPVRASVAEGAERERLFAQMAARMPGFAQYQRNTTRQIPVVVLTRAGE
jgi:deazaflavin-dependent oxidoreductase (nitroreductase family)